MKNPSAKRRGAKKGRGCRDSSEHSKGAGRVAPDPGGLGRCAVMPSTRGLPKGASDAKRDDLSSNRGYSLILTR